MIRRLYNILSALSLLACVATVILYARGLQSYECVYWGKAGGRLWLFDDFDGRLRLFIYSNWPWDVAMTWRRGSPGRPRP